MWKIGNKFQQRMALSVALFFCLCGSLFLFLWLSLAPSLTLSDSLWLSLTRSGSLWLFLSPDLPGSQRRWCAGALYPIAVTAVKNVTL